MSYNPRGRGPGGFGGFQGGGFGGGYGGPQIQFGFAPMTPTVKYLIIANVAVFFVTFVFRKLALPFVLVPAAVFPGLQVWRVVSYMFLHVGGWHLFFNMFALYMFGSALEQIWGRNRFLTFYFLCGIGAGVICVPFYILAGEPLAVILGASGAIYGVFVAFGLIYPNARVLFMFLIPIKVKHLIIILMAVEFATTASYAQGNTAVTVASVAHLSGAAIGYFHLRGLMDLKAYWQKLKTGRKKKAYRVIDSDDEERGRWLH